jgi:hypothetical protein
VRQRDGVVALREKGYMSFGVGMRSSGPFFAYASGAGLPFAAGRFDAVISLEVIEHVDLDGGGSRKRFSEELQRVTRPGV